MRRAQRSWTETHIVVPDLLRCCVCGLDTHFCQPDFEVPAHPGDCTTHLWRAYDRANWEARQQYRSLSQELRDDDPF